MASIKALAAIAITLMVAVPIGLGYGMASETTEQTVWTSGDSSNITDLLLNHSTPYYTGYTGPENNSWLTHATLGTVAPSFVETGTSASTVPIWSTTATTFTAGTIYTHIITAAAITGSNHISFDQDDVNWDDDDSYWLLTNSYPFVLHYLTAGATVYAQDVIYTGSTMSFGRDGASSWTMTYYNSSNSAITVEHVTNWSIDYTTSGAGVTMNGNVQSYIDLLSEVGSSDYYTFTANGPAASCCITDYNGTAHYFAGDDVVLIHNTQDVWICNGESFTNVQGVDYCDGGTASTFTGTLISTSGSYANPAAGWRLPSSSTYIWFNSHQLASVNLMIYIPDGESITLDAGTPVVITRSSSVTNVAGDALGNYPYLQAIISGDSYTVSGIAAWPTMSVEPTTYNTIEVENTAGSTPFSSFTITSGTSAIYRVDSAQIVAGTFPSTYNGQLPLGDYWPNQSVDIYINSVAVYGDNLTIVNMDNGTTVGTVFTITDGTITVDGTKVKLLHSHITSTKNTDGDWVTSIGGVEIMTTEEQPEIDFWGEWSFIVTLATMEEVTQTKVDWVAGGFAFDKEGFVAAGLLTACAAFVALGMTGRASGPKVALLALICGGGALVYLTIL